MEIFDIDTTSNDFQIGLSQKLTKRVQELLVSINATSSQDQDSNPIAKNWPAKENLTHGQNGSRRSFTALAEPRDRLGKE